MGVTVGGSTGGHQPPGYAEGNTLGSHNVSSHFVLIRYQKVIIFFKIFILFSHIGYLAYKISKSKVSQLDGFHFILMCVRLYIAISRCRSAIYKF